MNKIKERLKTRNGKVTIILLLALVVSLSVYVFVAKNKVPDPVVVFNEDITFEYGQDIIGIKLNSFVDVDKSNFEDASLTSYLESGRSTQINTLVVGTFSGELFVKYGKKEMVFEFDYAVTDTKAPKIIGVENITIEEGEIFKHQITAKDLVDGDLEVVIDGDYDVTKPGTFKLTASATDKNNNKTEKEFSLEVKEKEKVVVEQAKDVVSNNKPSGGNNSGSAVKTPNKENTSTVQPKPNPEKPKPTPKPVEPKPTPEPPKEDESWKRHPNDWKDSNGRIMYFYKKYSNVDSCILVMNDVLDEMAWGTWQSNYCDTDGSMYYTER